MKFTGKVVWKFGDNFNSDLITQYPKYKSLADPKELAKICMKELDPDFSNKVQKGDIMIAGRNFGYGHPHQQAHLALKAVGISVVIAESFSRNWFRTAINVGLPVIAVTGITKAVDVGDKLEVELARGEIRNLSTQFIIKTSPLPQFILDILEAGGLLTYLKSH